MLVAIDVDGTIHMDLDFPGIESVVANPNVAAVARLFVREGHTVILWSANGADYARMVAEAVQFPPVDGYFPKPPTRPITAETAALVLGAVPDLMIDDKPTEAIIGIPFLRP